VNFVPVTPAFAGERELFLILTCDGDFHGATSARMDLSGSLDVVSFVPLNGVVQSGALPTLDLVLPRCFWASLEGWFTAGALTVNDPAGLGGDVCFSGTPVTGDCSVPPAEIPHYWTGFSSAGASYCVGGTWCSVTEAISRGTWGRTKAHYRR
jgi:hypothetical protein